MKFVTKEFGELEINEQDIIKFSRSIYGFEGYTDYIVLKDDPDDSIMYLQSTEKPDLHFVLVDPYTILPDYSPILSQEDIMALGAKNSYLDELTYLLIAVIPEDVKKSVVNMINPLVIDPHSRKAIQAVLLNEEYALRYPLFPTEVGGDSFVSN